jgi:hypothetical protein
MADSIAITKQGQFADTRRDFVYDSAWMGGCDSLLYPTDLMQGCYAWSVNAINRGGIIQTRPRRKRLFSIPGIRAQGMVEFLTLTQTQYLVWAIDGLIYYSQYPFNVINLIPNLSFSPNAVQIYFCAQVQAAQYTPGMVGAPADIIEILPTPINYLFIQDGVSSPGWWDGTTAYQPFAPNLSAIANATTSVGVPIGGPMVASGGRLWVASGRNVYASDYVIPTQFREGTYLAETSGFQFPRIVTSMLQAPQNSGTFVFTDRGIYTLQSNILNRPAWQTTPLFQNTITEEFGCVAPFSPVYQHGLPWLWTAKGLLSMDMAFQTTISNVIYTRDGEMRRSKAKLSPTVTGVCTGMFENMMLVAVPHASQYNRHTWVMDGGIAPKLNQAAGLCWTGVWTGTYPVQFATIIYSGVEHNYELSYSNGYMLAGSQLQPISIWENFLTMVQNDDGITPVRSQFETRMFRMPNDEMMQACFVEVLISNLSGIATLSFSIGGIAGLYNLLSTSTFRADVGPFFNPAMMTIYYGFPGFVDTVIESYRPQNRYARSTETIIESNPNSAHIIEVGYSDYIDKGFQILLEWSGNLAIRGVKFYYRPFSIGSIGKLPSDEITANIVLEAQ